jgi:hypothetical protein
VGVGAGVAEVDLSFGDMVDEFDIGLMGLFEARRERWVLRTDLYYLSMSDQRAVSVSSTIPLDQEQLILQPEVGYAILRRDWGGVDALAGVRYWNLSLQLGSPPDTLTGDRNWVDGTVGLGLRYRPASSWQVFAKSDLGTGGSDFVWQALGGVGYDLGRCCTADAAYRHLSVDYRQDDFVYDVDLSGPAVGVTLHF